MSEFAEEQIAYLERMRAEFIRFQKAFALAISVELQHSAAPDPNAEQVRTIIAESETLLAEIEKLLDP